MFGGVVPAQVLRHPSRLQALPILLLVPVGVEAVPQRIDQLVGLRPVERPPEPALPEGIERDHRVAKPADGVHHRDRAVLHGVQLVQPAGLEPRWHEQDVRPCGDPVRHLHREPHPRPHLVVVLPVELAQHLLQVGPPGAQHHQLQVLPDDPRHRTRNEVDALLVIQPADESDEGDVLADREAELLLQRRLALWFPGLQSLNGIVSVAIGLQVKIQLRVPVHCVDPVDDASELPVVLVYDLMESPPTFGCCELPCVATADGDHAVSSLEAGREDVEVVTSHRLIQLEEVHVLIGQVDMEEVLNWTTPLDKTHR
ncbi:unnamed protein product [Musa acuminata subsp. malaccensis]|uniref:(wild Malaysian banana) hypothetical protein n=1 Tax=Musa acuminata subsp. malaccensis TaxID=214687 RepID=A0A8D7EXE6_MUSAM|nr:unnamed protein product [Musa acuminata subsp. malaccensis]